MKSHASPPIILCRPSATPMARACCRSGFWRLVAVVSLLTIGVLSASAAFISLTNSDAAGKSSFSAGLGNLGATNWDSGLPPASGNEYCVQTNFTLFTPSNNTAYTFAGDSLILAGTLGMKGTNLITINNLILSNGVVQNAGPTNAATPALTRLAGAVNVVTNAAFQMVTTNRSMAITAALSGSGDLKITGPGTTTLSGSHSYTGPLTLSGVTLDMDGTVSLTPSSLIVGKEPLLFNYATGKTNVYGATNIVRGGASLSVGNGSDGSTLRVGWATGSASNYVSVLDLSALSQLNANLKGSFVIGMEVANGMLTGLAYLATNNTIVATNCFIGDSAGQGSTIPCLLMLGKGSNYIDSPFLSVGLRKQDSTMTLPAGGTLVLTNSVSGRTDMTICGNTVGTSGQPTDLADFSGGPFTASLGNLVVGLKSGGNNGGGFATLTMSASAANAVDVNDVMLADLEGVASGNKETRGTLNFNGGTFTVNNSVVAGYLNTFAGNATITPQANGVINVNGGTFTVKNTLTLGSQGANGIFGSVASGNGTLNLNGGTVTINNNVTLAAVNVSGYGTSSGTINLTNGTLAVGGDITDGGGGTSTLNVNGGLLNLLPAGDSVKGNITVDVLNLNGTISNVGTISAPALSGTGSIVNQTGATTVSGMLDPGTATTAGTLNLGSLTLASTATLRLNLTNNATVGGGVNDLLRITGDLDLGNANLSLVYPNGLAVGTYWVITYTGELQNSLTLPGSIYSLAITNDTVSSPKRVGLRVGSGVAISLRWTGAANSTWDAGGAQNWLNQLSAPDYYYDLDSVRFDDTSANPTVTLDITVLPASVVFSNNLNAYDLSSPSGLGKISGAIGLTKQGAAPVTLSTSNDFTGPTIISAGTLQLGNGGSIGSLSPISAITNNGVLAFNRGNAVSQGTDFAPAITGTGGVSQNGLGTLTLSGANTYSGPTTVSVGTLNLNSPLLNSSSVTVAAGATFTEPASTNALILGAASVTSSGTANLFGGVDTFTGGLYVLAGTVTGNNGANCFGDSAGTIYLGNTSGSDNATLMYNGGGGVAIPNPIVVRAGSTGNTLAIGRPIGNTHGIFSGAIALNHDVTLQGTASASTRFYGIISGGGAVNVVGVSVRFATNNTYTGLTTIESGGTLLYYVATGSDMIKSGNNIVVNGTLNLAGYAQTFDSVTGIGSIRTGGGALTVGVNNSSPTFDGVMSEAGSLTKLGTGTLTLTGTNTYTGATTISNGTLLLGASASLAGTPINLAGGAAKFDVSAVTGGYTLAGGKTLSGIGVVLGAVTTVAGSMLAPGNSVGTLSFSNDLTLAGNLFFELNKSLTPSNDLVVVSGTLTNAGTGTLTVTNLGPALRVGDRFKLFSQPLLNGNALTIVSSGVTWANNLAVDGSIQVVAIGGGAPPSFPPGGIGLLPGGNISLTATGAVGTAYRLWASTNVALTPITNTWTLLSNGTITISPFTINDLTATNFPQRFYLFSTP